LAASPRSGAHETDQCPGGWFREKKHLGIVILTNTLDGLITALVDDAVEFSLEVSHILQQLIFLAVVASVVKANEPPRADALELIVNEMFDIPFQPMGLLAVLMLY
jgi:hypothetical protein